MKWHCPPDTGVEIRTLAVWGRARYLSVTEAPHNTDFHTRMGKKLFLFLSNRRDREPNPNAGVKGSGANHYPRAPPGWSGEMITRFIWWYTCWSVVPTLVKRGQHCTMYYTHLYGEIRKSIILLYMVFAITKKIPGNLIGWSTFLKFLTDNYMTAIELFCGVKVFRVYFFVILALE